jgi:mannose-6-phosphate isomerase-like protein (cupin superfamily)
MMEKERRPWGYFTVLQRGDKYCVKELFIEPEMRISLQFHRYRTEDWVVVDGSGIVTQGNVETECYRGDKFFIGIEMRHRMTAGKKGLTIIEVQRGKCVEDDIVRLEDDYNRVEHHTWGHY